MAALPGSAPHEGRLLVNILYFARTLRAAGLPIGPGKVLAAIEAVRAVGIESPRDFYWALHAVFVSRHDQRDLFHQAFHIFWRDLQSLQETMSPVPPGLIKPPSSNMVEMNRRLAEALHRPGPSDRDQRQRDDEIEIDTTLTFSNRELLQKIDFDKMSGAEITAVKEALRRMALRLTMMPTRRYMPDPRGSRTDLRASWRAQLRSGDLLTLHWKRRRTKPPPLVVLCDISGSMSRYSRLFLHFVHAITNDHDRVYTFLFGTRLTNITRYLRYRDVDVALDKVTDAVLDWAGGTRIGAALAEFNRRWSRCVLGQGAIVLLITDGLDREGGRGIAEEMERLHKSCRRLLWLNPLLRYEGFTPTSSGMKAILPHVDEFRPMHNLASLGELAAALSRPGPRRLEAAAAWHEAG